MNKYVIIVAGGSGSRMKTETPKQFLLLLQKPVIMHAIEAFQSYDPSIKIILVLPKDHFTTWRLLKDQHQFSLKHVVVNGGKSRFESVKNGLDIIEDDGVVAIHDGARPLVTSEVIGDTFQMAEKYGNAIATVALKDSIRETQEGRNWSVDRAAYQIIQTPQTFQVALIKQSFQKAIPEKQYTDDASVLEDQGKKINLTAGSYDNIKITTPEDLIMAEAILSARKQKKLLQN